MKNKKSTIRGENVRGCPFGLPVPRACNGAGGCVERMTPIDEDDDSESAAKRNKTIYFHHKEHKPCKYADSILENHDKVDCDFGDTASGKKTPAFKGSPLYPQSFTHINLDGEYGKPAGYGDDTNMRNIPFGLFSLIGKESAEKLVKIANKCDQDGLYDIADFIDQLLNIDNQEGM